MKYLNMKNEELNMEYNKLLDEYELYREKKLNIDMSRGKPSKEQLELSNDILNMKITDVEIDGFDIRNYGCLNGLPSARRLFADVFKVDESEIIIGGNSSLNLLHDLLMHFMLFPLASSCKPWCKYSEIKFLCPVPGYDRHFAILEKLGIKMVNVGMTREGPDMDQVENLVKKDNSVKGIICVPKYSNPTGITYSNDVINRLVNLKTKARDFVIIFDNAYSEHHLYDVHDTLVNCLDESKKSKYENRVYIFSSTSKMTFPGSGIAFIMSTEKNIERMKKWLSVETIGFDKVNQLRHALFFKNANGVVEHMKKHAEILRPKFKIVDQILTERLSGYDLASWSKPYGGYFISLDTLDGCAKKVIEMCKEAGITFTKAGTTFPYGLDPRDSNIRIAPSYLSMEELKTAIEILCLAIKIVSLENIRR